MLDLTKLKALELPTAEIEVEILGEKQKLTIQAMPMTLSVKIATMAEIMSDDPDMTTKILTEVLHTGAKGLTSDDIQLLLELEYSAAAKIAAEIRDLTKKFNEIKVAKKEEFEKNSHAAISVKEKIS